jgi:membrane protein
MKRKDYIKSKVHYSTRFIRFVITHFMQDDCAYVASALTFATLLAAVPLMVVSLALFTTFPAFEGIAQPLQNFIFDNFVPSTGKIVQSYIDQFTAQVAHLSIIGIIFLLIMAVLMMFTIEQAMNKIWRTKSSRHSVPAFLLYWTILSLAPVLIGLSMAISSLLLSIPFLVNNPILSFFIYYSPIVMTLTGYVLFYMIAPNCPVRFKHALSGALVATLLFELAKQAFAYYLDNFNIYELLYGAFSIVPIFFIWVYWAWMLTLLGAEISYAFSVHHLRLSGEPLDGFSHALLWLNDLWHRQKRGQGATINELITLSNQPFAVDIDDMITILTEHALIHKTATNEYMLSRDFSYVSLYDLTQMLPYRLPSLLKLTSHYSELSQLVEAPLKEQNLSSQKTLGMSLEALFSHPSNRVTV